MIVRLSNYQLGSLNLVGTANRLGQFGNLVLRTYPRLGPLETSAARTGAALYKPADLRVLSPSETGAGRTGLALYRNAGWTVSVLAPLETGAVRTGGPLYKSTYVAPLTIREAVVAWLRTLPSLTALVGTRIYSSDPSQISVYPAVTVKVSDRTYVYNLYGFAGASLITAEITAISNREATCVAIAEVVRDSFQGFRGMQSGNAILRCFLGDESDDTVEPPDGSDQWIYLVEVDYEILHRVSAPTSVTQVDV